MNEKEKVGIIGSGLIGRSWAMLFAGAGYGVMMYDILDTQISSALDDIKIQLQELEKSGLLRGSLNSQQQYELIKGTNNISDAVVGAVYVQECIPEQLELKKKLFGQLDDLADDNVILASSTSCIVPSKFTEELKHRQQCIVAHPINPPYYVPLVEMVPAPWTSPEVTERARAIQEKCGQKPIVFRKEVEGFGINRLQYALLNECNRLVQDEVLSVEDVDKVMAYGLGHRYAFLGCLETALLNAEGWPNYCDRYGETIVRVSETFGPTPTWKSSDQVIQDMQQQYEARGMGIEGLPERRAWRDKRLAALAKLKKDLEEEENK